MLKRFANIYWSADNRTGIEQLLYQTLRSIQQLHEVRELVISYVTYCDQRDLQLTKMAVELFPLESGFRPYVKGEKLVHQGNTALKKLGESILMATGYESADTSIEGIKRLSGYLNENQNPFSSSDSTLLESLTNASNNNTSSLTSSFESHIQNLLAEAQAARRLRRAIEKEVMENLNNFIRHNEPQLRRIIQEFQDLLANYESTYFEADSLRSKYDETRRQKEFYEQKNSPPDLITTTSTTPSDFVDDSIEEVPSEPPSPLESNPLDKQFTFPLRLGPVVLKDMSELANLIDRLDKLLPTTKRTIPIPSYRNLIFKSEDLVNVITSNRLFDPSRARIERFGQALIDLKLMSGTGFMTAKHFKADNLWYELSNLALQVVHHEDQKLHPTYLYSADGSQASVNEVALKLSGMFKNVKANWLKGDYNQKLEELEEQYRNAYLEFQDAKHLLDSKFFRRAIDIEGFEKLKIETIHHAFTKLAEVLYKSSQDSTTRLKEFARDFITKYDDPNTFQLDYNKLIEDFSVGIYFPSLQPIKSRLYVNAQDVKTGFNLFKDIPLQLLCSQMNHQISSTFASTPYLMYKVIRLIESKKGSEDLREIWTRSLDFRQYWSVKDELIRAVGEFDPLSVAELASSELEIHKNIMENLIELLNGKTLEELINFVRNWLLEINDTIIPCMMFELLISHIKLDIDTEDLVKLLSSLPRSNMSSLLFILEHICRVFKLDEIEDFESFRDGGGREEEEGKVETKSNVLDELVVSELNSMEAIGSIPFVHLILRPIPSKNSKGFKPPLELYNLLLSKLLDVQLRSKLLKVLWSHEKSYLMKKEAEKISIQKTVPTLAPPPQNGSVTPTRNGSSHNGYLLPSPRPPSGEFSLRPFRTRTTPLPSPSSSPRLKTKIEQSASQQTVKESPSDRVRSASGTFLPPPINILFEGED